MWTAGHAKRLVYLVHRWTGVGGCLLMLLWVVSGVVMLFVGYPRLLPEERLLTLPPLAAACCVPVEHALAASPTPLTVRQIVLTSIAGQPVYRLRDKNGALLTIDASSGRPMPPVDEARALASARHFLQGANGQVQGRIADDRWTHSGALDAHRPLIKVQMEDAASTLLYVSSVTGEVVMDAPAAQRAWNFVGAWLHWLYMFRDGSRDPVWSWTVIVLSAIATASALTGALVGIWRWRFGGRYKSGAKTPYREFHMRWHHLTGLIFGVVLTTWIFSGLMSMNPMGVFDATERPDAAAYQGGTPGGRRVALHTADALAELGARGFAAHELEWKLFAGEPHLLARNGAGDTRLVLHRGGVAEVHERWPHEHLAHAAQRLMKAPVASAQSLHAYDAYYFKRHEASMYAGAERRLPVLRVDYADAARTAVYIDVNTGDLALSVDRAQRTGRWLFNFLHSWDLPAMLAQARTRDTVLVALSLGAALITLTGMVIGWRRLKSFCLRARRASEVGRSP